MREALHKSGSTQAQLGEASGSALIRGIIYDITPGWFLWRLQITDDPVFGWLGRSGVWAGIISVWLSTTCLRQGSFVPIISSPQWATHVQLSGLDPCTNAFGGQNHGRQYHKRGRLKPDELATKEGRRKGRKQSEDCKGSLERPENSGASCPIGQIYGLTPLTPLLAVRGIDLDKNPAWMTAPGKLARNHGDDGLCQTAVEIVPLDDQRGTTLGRA